MIVEMLVPLLQRHIRARELLVNEVFDLNKLRIRIGGQKNHALHDLWPDLLAIMVIWTVHSAVFVTMGHEDVDVVAIGRAFCLLLSEEWACRSNSCTKHCYEMELLLHDC